jgi:hypothetical protein
MGQMMLLEIVPLKKEVNQVSGQVSHVFDPDGKFDKYLVDVDAIVSVCPYDKKNNVFEVTFAVAHSYRRVMIKSESVELLQKEINNLKTA